VYLFENNFSQLFVDIQGVTPEESDLLGVKKYPKSHPHKKNSPKKPPLSQQEPSKEIVSFQKVPHKVPQTTEIINVDDVVIKGYPASPTVNYKGVEMLSPVQEVFLRENIKKYLDTYVLLLVYSFRTDCVFHVFYMHTLCVFFI